ncbi:peptidyl-prolyl cis-trans isomerase B [Candidatus Nitrotoga sp. HW29]|uniref:peptidylprolyl isomerase n=1 Tax=Candidatus Nitrotoga sp. HW29 TaxID=2886963 RepID=UPI001EF21E5F|nr:peptidylprolyl isomerase [Candidatus Nitrotoga sp. HW29]CAH1906468.1 peptidyl-prolyl cis-trans isomerase B [Candidatus Nitrotoga sp. HW29]
MVKLHTNYGIITLELDAEKAPATVKNFLEYVNSGFYYKTIFHRVIDGFVIQGGGYNYALGTVSMSSIAKMSPKSTNSPIKNEAANGLKNDKYTIAMARRSAPHSATSQFFINLKDNDSLNYTAADKQGYGYCVFGRVVAGTEVLDAISKVQTGNRYGLENVPLEDVVLKKAEEVQ